MKSETITVFRFIVASLGIAFLVTLLAVILKGPQSWMFGYDQKTHQAFEKIEPGLSQKEVIQRLGPYRNATLVTTGATLLPEFEKSKSKESSRIDHIVDTNPWFIEFIDQ